MALRGVLVALVLAATGAFVVGTALERNSSGDHHETSAISEAGESAGAPTETEHAELRPLGVDVEAWPFVAIAAAASLALAAAAWRRPRVAPLLALALLGFAALDVREVVHQLDVDKTGLAVLAAVIAALHVAAAVVAATMARRSDAAQRRAAGTMPV